MKFCPWHDSCRGVQFCNYGGKKSSVKWAPALRSLAGSGWHWIYSSSIGDTARINTLRPRQSGRHFADEIFKCIFLNENVWIPITISLKFVPKGPINNIPALVQIMAWRRPGDKPLSEPMMVVLPTHICVTRPQWVKIAISPYEFKFSFIGLITAVFSCGERS